MSFILGLKKINVPDCSPGRTEKLIEKTVRGNPLRVV